MEAMKSCRALRAGIGGSARRSRVSDKREREAPGPRPEGRRRIARAKSLNQNRAQDSESGFGARIEIGPKNHNWARKNQNWARGSESEWRRRPALIVHHGCAAAGGRGDAAVSKRGEGVAFVDNAGLEAAGEPGDDASQ